MGIPSDQFVQNAANLSQLNTLFHEYVNRQNINESIDFGSLSDNKFMQRFQYGINSWPLFLSQQTRNEFQALNSEVPRLMAKALKTIFATNGELMAKVYGLNPVLCSLLLGSFDIDSYCFRSDAMYTAQGVKVVELNMGTSCGGWELQWLDDIFRNVDCYKTFFAENQVEAPNIPLSFFSYLIRAARPLAEQETVRILIKVGKEFDSQDYGSYLQHYMDNAAKNAGIDCDFIFFNEFYDDNLVLNSEGVYYYGKKVHLITFGDLSGDVEPPVDLLRMIIAGQVFCPDVPTVQVFGDKRNFAIMYEAIRRNVYTPEEVALVKKFVPLTHVVKGVFTPHSITEEIYNNKDMYVVKPCDGLQGDDVFVGRYMTDSQWRDCLDNLDEPSRFLAQEFCESLQYYGHTDRGQKHFDIVWGAFQFGGEFGGCCVRMMEQGDDYDGVINSARGAQDRFIYNAQI